MKNSAPTIILNFFKSGLLAFPLLMFSQLNAQLYISSFEKFGIGIGTRRIEPFNLEARLSTNNRLAD